MKFKCEYCGHIAESLHMKETTIQEGPYLYDGGEVFLQDVFGETNTEFTCEKCHQILAVGSFHYANAYMEENEVKEDATTIP